MSSTIARVRGVLLVLRHPRRVAASVLGLVALFLYVWYAAVRAVPDVRRRKAAVRIAWKNRHPRDRG